MSRSDSRSALWWRERERPPGLREPLPISPPRLDPDCCLLLWWRERGRPLVLREPPSFSPPRLDSDCWPRGSLPRVRAGPELAPAVERELVPPAERADGELEEVLVGERLARWRIAGERVLQARLDLADASARW